VVVAASMPRLRTVATREHIDIRGALFLVSGLVPLLTALTVTRQAGFGSPLAIGLLAVGTGMLAAFGWVEAHAAHPVMPFVLFRTPTFTVSVVVSFLAAFGMFGSNIFVPLLYQGLLGLTATQSGFFLAPRLVAMVAASLISGQIVSRIDHYRFIGSAGLICLASGLFLMSRVTATSSEAEVVRDLVLIGIGFGSTQPIYQNAVMSAVPHRYVGVASSQVQFWRSLGQTMGVTVLGAVLAAQIGVTLPDPDAIVTSTGSIARQALSTGLQYTFLVAAGAAAVAAVAALSLKEVPMRGRLARVAPGSAVLPEPAAIGD
jgi:MFS family permease